MVRIICGIPVEVVRKRIKHLYLAVLPPDGAVRVSAPMGTPNAAIERFVQAKRDWIRQHRERLRSRPAPAEAQFVTGETIPVWGKPYPLRVEHAPGKSALVLTGDEAVLTVPADSTREQREAAVDQWYRSQLKTAIARCLPRWEAATGLRCTGWQIRDMKTRWGSCTTGTGKIRFNLQLAKHPKACLEYVVLHELAHLAVSGHGPAFQAILDRHMPDWRARRRALNAPPPA